MRNQPTTPRGVATVDKLLDAACDLFARQGIRATTLDQVGAASGTGRGQLYHYFEGKPDLVREVVTRQVERVLSAQRPHLEALATGGDLHAVGAALAEQYAQDDPVRCPVGSLVHEVQEDDGSAREALADGFRRWQLELQDALTRAVTAGTLELRVSPQEMATTLLATYQGAVLVAAATGRTHAIASVLHTLVDLALSGEPGDDDHQVRRKTALRRG